MKFRHECLGLVLSVLSDVSSAGPSTEVPVRHGSREDGHLSLSPLTVGPGPRDQMWRRVLLLLAAREQ